MNLVKTNKIKTLILNKEYSLSGNSQYIIFNKEADTDAPKESGRSLKESARSTASDAVKMTHTVGLIWCTVQGLSRGCMYSGQKIAQ